MGWVQRITPNPNIACRPGWCWEYVSNTFGINNIPHTNYPTATAAWNASTTKHRDYNFPANVWVPIWFSLKYEPAGHVALRAPDGSIYSTSHPTNKTPYKHPSLEHLIQYYANANPLTFLGWTEDAGGIRVIEWKAESTSQGGSSAVDTIKSMYWRLLGRESDPSGINTYTKAASEKGWEFVYNDLKNSPEGQADWNRRNPDRVKDLESKAAQLAQANAALDAEKKKSAGLATSLNDSQLALKEARTLIEQAQSIAQDDEKTIKSLTAQLAEAKKQLEEASKQPTVDEPKPTAPATTGQGFGDWLANFLNQWKR